VWHSSGQNVDANFIGHFERDRQQMNCLLRSLKGHDKKACLPIANRDQETTIGTQLGNKLKTRFSSRRQRRSFFLTARLL